jgi:hypothetical protein
MINKILILSLFMSVNIYPMGDGDETIELYPLGGSYEIDTFDVSGADSGGSGK